MNFNSLEDYFDVIARKLREPASVTAMRDTTKYKFPKEALIELALSDAQYLRKEVERIEREWVAACPHQELAEVKVIPPSAMPAECNVDSGGRG